VSPCIAPFSGTGQSVSTSIGVVAKPMIVFGQKPSVQNTPLPEFNLNSPQAGSHVVLEGNLPFDAASKILSILNPPKVNPNSPPLLFGSINAIHPVGVYSNSDSFHIVVIVDGNVSLNLDNTL
jgi:hypothetical protein